MIIQIFGTKKSKDTQKAVRFFKERRIQIQEIDLSVKGMSKGELASVRRSVPLEELIDTGCAEYEKLNLRYIVHDIADVLLEKPLLFKMPVVRMGDRATAGYAEAAWKEWLAK